MRFVCFEHRGDVALAIREKSKLRVVGRYDRPGVNAAFADLGSVRASGDSDTLDVEEVTLLPPVPRPGKVICIGLNYVDHAKEGGNPIPDYPAVFLRAMTSIVGPGVPIVRPPCSDKFDFEAELAVVIGRPASRVSERDTLSHVAGYTCFNDGSIRDYQRKSTQWTMGKNFDASGALGPEVVTPDELPEGARGLRVASRLNGETMQDGNTADMIFSIPRLIEILSEVMTLEPGDVIATGTPAGVGYARKPPVFMRPGDVCEIDIEGIGTLRNTIGG
ncbi:MAG TPA: fumarylacetoacetate hydrolase family protein [Beijerinckiaceae bacterium]|jgi:2-keto-4-pentenoate hydratase/2-oxohepta-3-ene-1,7-dioic acid hydratase in catechol pathway